MVVKKVTTIPATISKFSRTPINEVKKRRVAAYARVSTDSEEQQTSYEAQIDYYTNYINDRVDWEYAGMYTDEGITGTSTAKRVGFQKMIDDALLGKIDLIITKSVSRFARNTVDSLTTVRKLRDKGIEIYFEKENIWTLDSKGELLITIMSSLAQEESRSISENCTWGQRKRFADGKVSVPFQRFLGYDKGPDGNLVVNPEQAKIVKRIYLMFLRGHSPFGIAKALTEDGIPTPGGKKVWGTTAVKSILSNEKYKGDALLQKSFTVDFLTKKKKKNEGEVPQYYVKNNHEAIIPEETFNRVQRLLEQRQGNYSRISSVNMFSSKIKCGCCGGFYGSKVWHSNSEKYRKEIWKCNQKVKGVTECQTPHLTDEEIKQAFITATNQLIKKKRGIIKTLNGFLDEVLDTTELEKQQGTLEEQLEHLVDTINESINENARTVQNQEEYERHYNQLVEKYDALQAELNPLKEEISNKQIRKDEIRDFLTVLQKAEPIEMFDEDLWYSLVDYIQIEETGQKTVRFQDGTEITV